MDEKKGKGKKLEVQVETSSQRELDNTQDHVVFNEHDHDSNDVEQDEWDYGIAIGRQKRQIRPLQRYAHADLVVYALTTTENIDGQEPSCYSEAVKSKVFVEWCATITKEFESPHKNQT